MADESPSEEMNICNSILAEEEATANLFTEKLCKKIVEKFDALISHQKTENSNPSDAFAFKADLEKYSLMHEALVAHNRSMTIFREAYQTRVAEKSYHSNAFPSPKSIRKKETAFNRECNRLEKVWANRGLPVDKESLSAAANKDAFDMAGLKESLPSTSSGEVDSATRASIASFFKMEKGIQKMWQQRLPPRPWHMKPDTERFETKNCTQSPCTSIVKPMIKTDESQGSPAAETKPPRFLSMEENYLKLARLRRSLQRRTHLEAICSGAPPLGKLERRYLNYKLNAKAKETGNLAVGNSSQDLALPNQEMYKCPELVEMYKCPELVEMSLVGRKKKEGQNSAVENKHKNAGFSHLNLRRRLAPGWDLEKGWSTDFYLQGTHGSSPNTLTKKEIDRALSKCPPDLHELRKRIRDQSKLRAMNSRRGVISEDMVKPERRNPFSEEVPIPNKHEKAALYLKKLKMHMKIIKSMKESVKGFQCLKFS